MCWYSGMGVAASKGTQHGCNGGGVERRAGPRGYGREMICMAMLFFHTSFLLYVCSQYNTCNYVYIYIIHSKLFRRQ